MHAAPDAPPCVCSRCGETRHAERPHAPNPAPQPPNHRPTVSQQRCTLTLGLENFRAIGGWWQREPRRLAAARAARPWRAAAAHRWGHVGGAGGSSSTHPTHTQNNTRAHQRMFPTPACPSCVFLYCLLNVILTAFCYVRERDSFMVTQPKLVRLGTWARTWASWQRGRMPRSPRGAGQPRDGHARALGCKPHASGLARPLPSAELRTPRRRRTPAAARGASTASGCPATWSGSEKPTRWS